MTLWPHRRGGQARYRACMIDAQTIEKAGSRLAAAAHPAAQVYLFGSAARAETTYDSDIDFLVIQPGVRDTIQESVRLRRAVGDVGAPLDIIVMDSALAARRAKVPGTVVHHAFTDGRLVSRD